MLRRGRGTEFGWRYDLGHVRSVEQFQSMVETFDYETFKPYIEKMLAGERNVTAPGRVKLFARSSGTTSDRSKYIPVTEESLWWNHTLGMRDVATVFAANNPKTKVFDGKTLTLGGSCSREGRNLVGDLSAVLIHETTFWSGWFRAPRTETAIIPDFDEKCAAICRQCVGEPITAFAGVPSWNLALMRRVLEYTGRKNLLEVRAGLLTKRSYRIAADKIGYLDIRRSLLTCLLGVYSIFLSTVGYGKFRDDVSALIPCVRKKQLERSLRLLLPEYRISQRKVAPHRLRSAVRYIWRAAALLVLVLLLRGILSLLFPGWVELIQWVSFMASVPLIWLLIVKVIDLFTAGLSYEDGCYTLRYSKGFSLHAVVIRRGRIAKVRIGQSIFQKRTGRCDLYLYSYSEGRQRHHLRDLKREEVEDLFSFMDTESSGNL